ncbi:hypothetical protein C8Q80DRAFT_1344069 [Daedaleopsis nitida]|nr:hypothetical protein C8Q80DRAFT_1344069 [Daedaleopsis nitida]
MDHGESTLERETPSAIIIYLKPPESASVLERRDADLIRMGFSWNPASSEPDLHLVPFSSADTEMPDDVPLSGTKISSTMSALDTDLDSSSEQTAGSTIFDEDVRESENPKLDYSVHIMASTPAGPSFDPPTTEPHHPLSISQVAASEPPRRPSRSRQPLLAGHWLSSQQNVLFTLRVQTSRTAELFSANNDDMVTHDLALDTGSDMSWILGDYYHVRFPPSKHGPQVDIPHTRQTEMAETARNCRMDMCDVIHNTMSRWNHLYDSVFSDGQLPADVNDGRVTYENQTVVWTVLAKTPHPYVLSNSLRFYDDGRTEPETEIMQRFQFAIAYRVTYELHLRLYDGILGLGPSSTQRGFRTKLTTSNGPSFMEYLVRKKALRKVPKELGWVLYCALRYQRSERKSWIALNGWPQSSHSEDIKHIRWSSNIRVLRGLNTDDWTSWTVRLRKLIIFLDLESNDSESRNLKINEFDFSPPITVVLDTGSSVSWVPPKLVRCMRTIVFATDRNRALDDARGDAPSSIKESKPDYTVPMSSTALPFDPRKLYVELCFEGSDGKDVLVPIPGTPFLFTEEEDKTEYQGTLLTTVRPGLYILGLPLFQSALIALHRPETKDPYVRMYGQWSDHTVDPPPFAE